MLSVKTHNRAVDAAIPGRSKEMYKICICDDESIFLDKINEIVKVFFPASPISIFLPFRTL